MESINNNKVKYRFLVFILAFMVAIAPLGNIKKVEALSPSDLKLVSPFIIGLILTSLVASGAVSGGYQVSPTDLSSIAEKAQANLQAAGSAAIDQANKLGEAIKSGAESAKIKALVSGAVIYAFLIAINDVLFPEKDIPADLDLTGYRFIGAANGYRLYWQERCTIPSFGWRYSWDSFHTLKLEWGENKSTIYTYSGGSEARLICPDNTTKNGYIATLWEKNQPIHYGSFSNIETKYAIIVAKILGVTVDGANFNNIQYVSNIKEMTAESVKLPTILPQTIINNITNWDGTSDLVLAPPLPYDIPTGEDLVIDPSYTGSEVEDPDTPDIPDKPEDIDMPWLSALLALLGLGNPSLDGIEAGVKTPLTPSLTASPPPPRTSLTAVKKSLAISPTP